MTRRILSASLALVLAAAAAAAEERHPMRGVVVSVDRAARSMVVSTDPVPGFMAAMAMPYPVRDAAALEKLTPGAAIDFVYVVDGKTSYALDIRIRGFESFEQKPMEAERLKVLKGLIDPAARASVVPTGQRVPDFTLKDQTGAAVTLASLGGKVVALTFGYVRCPNPAYCFRLASNLGQLQTRFKDRLGRDLVLLTVVLDPEHDLGRALTEYARVWTTQPANWHFLTGSVPEVRRVAGYFGVEFWKDEGSVIHTLNTVVIDRQGRLAANLEGNAFSAQQLADVIKSALQAP
jgi:protein SCO1/2